MSKNRRLLLGHLLSSTALVGASAVGLTVTAPVGSALADCSTGMPMPGQTVNCSGVDNTGVYAGNGYRNITVNLLAGASIENPGTNAIDLNGSSSVNLQAGSLIETNGFDAIRFSDQQAFYSGNSTVTLNDASLLAWNASAVQANLVSKVDDFPGAYGYSFNGAGFNLNATDSNIEADDYGVNLKLGFNNDYISDLEFTSHSNLSLGDIGINLQYTDISGDHRQRRPALQLVTPGTGNAPLPNRERGLFSAFMGFVFVGRRRRRRRAWRQPAWASGSCVMKFTISSEWNPSDMGVCTPSMQATS